MDEILVDKELAGAVVMASEPIPGYTTEDIRRWLKVNDGDARLADAMAAVNNKTAWLGHDLDDEDCSAEELSRREEEHDAWWALQVELVQEIARRLENENRTLGTRHITKGIGFYNIIKPFMERNGYMDGRGWWVK